MILTNEKLEQDGSHRIVHWNIVHWKELQQRFQRQQEAYSQKMLTLRIQRQSLQKQRDSLEQERLLYEQERSRLWNDIQTEWQLRDEHRQQRVNMGHRIQMSQDFSNALLYHRQHFTTKVQAFYEQLAALREQRALLKELSDHAQQQEGYQQLQTIYLEMQQELREYRQLLQEQQASYSHMRLNYDAERRLILAQKPDMCQQQKK
jgi:hypothetical protein